MQSKFSLTLLRAALHACNTTPRRRVALVGSAFGGWLRDAR
jgi:hypothetical protein